MQQIRSIKDTFFIAFGCFEIIAGASFFISSYLANKSMGKDGTGDLDSFINYMRLSGISFYGFLICMTLAITLFIVGKKTLNEIIKPIAFPASLPILWVPFLFFALYGAALILLKL